MEKHSDISWPLQISYLLLFEAGTACALWQKGHTNLTLGIMSLAPFLMLLSRIPFKFFPNLIRQLLQLVLVGLGLAWFQQRAESCPLDIAIIECSAVIVLALFISCKLREHSMMALVSIAFAGYGGLTPGRQMYFPAFITTIAISVIILYQTRTLSLARMGGISQPQMPKYWGNWLFRCIHFILVLALGAFFLIQIPIRNRLRTKGIAPVSFHTEQDLEFPSMWKDWFAPTKKLITKEATKETVDGDNIPTLSSKKSIAFVQDNSPKTLDARQGKGGSSAIGKDLVFRAYSPAKLYWVMQIYDTYDGNTWSRSQSLLQGINALDLYQPKEKYEVVQHISIEKAVSLRLPYAYRPAQATFRDRLTSNKGFTAMLQRADAVSFVLRTRNVPETPWNYKVQSFVPAPDLKMQPRAWNEPARNFGWNCRSLPSKVITPRLRNLARTITENRPSPMEKANAIRNYLRQNYKYNLEVKAIPPDRETVDHFLFETREGYCQHFAQAMVVLARLSGLHARLVTGFSPGNFNVLANHFEVYEYHAHAWAHIFIEPYGWLTYDGVPPGEMNMGNNTSILSSVLDPFDEKWSDSPPELSYKPQIDTKKVAKETNNNNNNKSDEKKDKPESTDKKKDFYDEVYAKAVLDNKSQEPTPLQLLKASKDLLMSRLKKIMTSAMAAARNSIRNWAKSCWNMAMKILVWCKSRPIIQYVLTAFAFLSIWFLWRKRHASVKAVKRHWRFFKCKKLWKKINSGSMDLSKQITACQHLNNELLDLAAFRRPPLSDVEERADALPDIAAPLTKDYLVVANAALNCWYSPHPPEQKVTAKVLESTASFMNNIKPFLNQKWRKQHS